MGLELQSSQPRKKRVLEEVQKQRTRQKRITLVAIAAVLIGIIVGGAYVLAHQSSSNLPAYLNTCVSGYGNGYHAHYHLAIDLNGRNVSIPSQTGINGSCLRPLHTHAADNVVHVEPDNNQTFTLGDFFMVWGQPFNSTRIIDSNYQPGQLSMTINGKTDGVPSTDFWDYEIPHNAEYASNTCSPADSCEAIDIILIFNPSAAAVS